MGLTASCALAAAGRQVVLIDANHPVRGSWGVSRASHLRIEDSTLLRMGLFSIRYWRALQHSYREALPAGDESTLFYKRTGTMVAGPTDAIRHVAKKVSAELEGMPEGEAEILHGAAATKRFPQVRLEESESLMYMPEGYTMLVNTCIESLKWSADRMGVVQIEGSVERIDRACKRVSLEDGTTYPYGDLVVSCGPWTNKVLSCAGLTGVPLVVSNEQTVELKPKAGSPSHGWDHFPTFTWSEAGYKGRNASGGCRYFYTTPHVDTLSTAGSDGVKIGYHRQGALLDTDDFLVTEQGRALKGLMPHDRKELRSTQEYELDKYSWEMIREFVSAKMPHLDVDHRVGYMRCLYQCTPDLQMIVGRHPEDSSVVFTCGYSGSGFQFAPAIANLIAALVLSGDGCSVLARDAAEARLHVEMLAKFDPRRFDHMTL